MAERRIKVLEPFGPEIIVISPEVSEYIKQTASSFHKRKYQEGDIALIKPFLVIAATDDRQVNHSVMVEAKNLDIHGSIADSWEESTCFFPAIAESEGYITGIVSKNGDHKGVKKLAERIRKELVR